MGRITIDLTGAANDPEVLRSALSYAAIEGAAMRIVLPADEAEDAFQDELHHALLETVRNLGRRPRAIEVNTTLSRLRPAWLTN